MTCVAGLVCNSCVYIGADSAGVDDNGNLIVRADAKVFRKGHMLFGATSSFRMAQLLRYVLEMPPPQPAEMDAGAYMVAVFIPAVRQCLKDGGYSMQKDGTDTGGNFLVGYNGTLYQVESDFQVGHAVDPWAVIGSGQAYAAGALYATRYDLSDPESRIIGALKAAERHNARVRGPFRVLSLPPLPLT